MGFPPLASALHHPCAQGPSEGISPLANRMRLGFRFSLCLPSAFGRFYEVFVLNAAPTSAGSRTHERLGPFVLQGGFFPVLFPVPFDASCSTYGVGGWPVGELRNAPAACFIDETCFP